LRSEPSPKAILLLDEEEYPRFVRGRWWKRGNGLPPRQPPQAAATSPFKKGGLERENPYVERTSNPSFRPLPPPLGGGLRVAEQPGKTCHPVSRSDHPLIKNKGGARGANGFAAVCSREREGLSASLALSDYTWFSMFIQIVVKRE
jgi:hypothetical protein